MPKLKPETEQARRQHILDAAERCFARGGFHGTTMQHICKEASVSPGALYVYFDSKEALIAGLCERDRAELTERLESVAEAPDFLAALTAIGETYFREDPVAKRRIVVEMGLEATRNPRVAEVFLGTDKFCMGAFEELFRRLKAEGRIDPAYDVGTIAKVFFLIGDGLLWRRACIPDFDVREVLPILTAMIGGIVRPVEQQAGADRSADTVVPAAHKAFGQTSSSEVRS